MKNRAVIFISTVVVLLGVVLFLYPSANNYRAALEDKRKIAEYEQIVHEHVAGALESAREYNSELYSNCAPDNYLTELNLGSDGIMGYVEIDKIGVELPIYHGCEPARLAVGAGHIEGTSLPVGGENTHSAITAHRGYYGVDFFLNLDELEIGDTIELNVLDETLQYKVHDILTIEPTEVQYLEIIDGEDVCTLVTCTPYGVNSHRLLVRAYRSERVDEVEKGNGNSGILSSELVRLVVACIVAAVVLSCWIALLLQRMKAAR